MCLLSLIVLLSRALSPYLCARFLGVASLSIMAEIVPAGVAPYYNLLWRFSTAYLAALAGFVCLLRALWRDTRRVTST